MVITGAGLGIGQSLAVQINQEGAHLALRDIDSQSFAETRRLLSQDSKVSLHTVDVSSQQQMSQFDEEVIAEHGQADFLINDTGIT